MKHFLLFITLLLSVLSLSAVEVQMDTIYYDNQWKGVSNPHFATYYRVLEKNPVEGYKTMFRDFYISGEIQGEGYYVSVDRFDDSKSVWDGDVIAYHKNGKIARKSHYDNGVLNGENSTYFENGQPSEKANFVNGTPHGEFIVFFENGSIKQRGNMDHGLHHGLYTEFNENGLCFQQEFWRGEPKYDYYVVSNDNGLFSKIKTSDNTPIYMSPSLSQKKVEYIDGTAWPYYINDGIMIAMSNSEINDYGKYYRIYINLTNNSFYPIEFDPSESVAILTDNKGKEIALEIQTAQQYDKRIRRTQMWEEALIGFAEGMAAANAGYSTSTTTSTYSGSSYSRGRASVYGSGGYAYGNYSGNSNYYGSSTSTTRTYDAGVAYAAQMQASQNMAALSESNFQIRQARQEGYLKRTTINPGESISGYFNIKRKKGDSLMITLNIAGAEYQFPWNVNHKK